MNDRNGWNLEGDDESEECHKSSRTNKYTENWEDHFTCQAKENRPTDAEEEGSTIESGIWLDIIGADEEQPGHRTSEQPELFKNGPKLEKRSNNVFSQASQVPAFIHKRTDVMFQGSRNSPPISFLTRQTTCRDPNQLVKVSQQKFIQKMPNALSQTEAQSHAESKSPLKQLLTTDTMYHQTRLFDSRGDSQEKDKLTSQNENRGILRSFNGLINTEQSNMKQTECPRSILQPRRKSRLGLGSKPLLNLNEAKKLSFLAAPSTNLASRKPFVDPTASKSVSRCQNPTRLEVASKLLRKSFADEVQEEPEVKEKIKQGAGLEMSYLRVSLRANAPPSINLKKLCRSRDTSKEGSLSHPDIKQPKATRSPDLKHKLKQMFAYEQMRLTLEVPHLLSEVKPGSGGVQNRSKSRKMGQFSTQNAKR